MNFKNAAAVIGAMALAGCQTIDGAPWSVPPGPGSAVAVAALPTVLNTVKCDLADFLRRYPRSADGRLKVNGVTGSLVFNLTRTATTGGGFGLAVAPAGVKIGAKASADLTRGQVYKTTLSIAMDAKDAPDVDCAKLERLPVRIIDLTALAAQLELAAAGKPRIAINKVKFEGQFYLEQNTSASGGIDLVFVKLGDVKAENASKYGQAFELEVDTSGTAAFQ